MLFIKWVENVVLEVASLYSTGSLEASLGGSLYCFCLKQFDFTRTAAKMVFAQGLYSFLH